MILHYVLNPGKVFRINSLEASQDASNKYLKRENRKVMCCIIILRGSLRIADFSHYFCNVKAFILAGVRIKKEQSCMCILILLSALGYSNPCSSKYGKTQ